MRAVGVLVIIISALLLSVGAPAYASSPAATTIGPMQISPVGHPHLCWQATGNGAPIALATCDSGQQNQQWTLNPDGTLLNGLGYCLEALPGHSHGTPLYIDFADQCGGSRSGQVWTYTGSNGQLSSTGICAGLSGSPSSGTQIVRARCGHSPRWSLGYSQVTLTPGPASGTVGGNYSASFTVTNAASAQTAYGVITTITLPPSLPVTAIHGTGVGGTGFRCTVQTLTCTGTLSAGLSARIDLTGSVPSGATADVSYSLSAKVAVHNTSQQSGTTRTTALLNLAVAVAAVPAPAARGVVLPLSTPLLILIFGLFVLVGVLLVGLALRRRPARSRASVPSDAPAHPHHPAYPGPQISADLRPNVPVQGDARTSPDARPPAYEGRRRRTGPDAVPEPEAEPLARPGRHHADR